MLTSYLPTFFYSHCTQKKVSRNNLSDDQDFTIIDKNKKLEGSKVLYDLSNFMRNI